MYAHTESDSVKMEGDEVGDTSTIGLRRFSVLSISSTNLSLLEKRLVCSGNELSSQHSKESERANNGSAHSLAVLNSSHDFKQETPSQLSDPLRTCRSIDVVPDIKIDCSASHSSTPEKTKTYSDTSVSDMCATGLLNVEPDFTRSSDAFASCSSHNAKLETIDPGCVLDKEASVCLERVPTQSSVCSINIESCSTDDSQSETEIDNDLLHSRRNSVANVPKRLA